MSENNNTQDKNTQNNNTQNTIQAGNAQPPKANSQTPAPKTKPPKTPVPETPAKGGDAPKVDANPGADIASAIVEGLMASKEDKTIRIKADNSVTPRFSLVRNKSTKEVLIRENATKILSKVQLESLEEKEAKLQDADVEEL